jgi:Flp pilus assembly protein TadG
MIRRLAPRKTLIADRRGAVAVEFALVMPMLLILYLGGFAASEAVSSWRKLSDTTSQLTSVTGQFTSMQASDAQGVMSAAAQIMAPYDTSTLKEVLTLVAVDTSGNATVTWSQAYNGGTAIAKNTKVTLPANMVQPNTTVIWVQTSYTYTPIAGIAYVPAIPMSGELYGLPRSSGSIPCSDC